jgi:hypothetical protein
MFTSYDMPSIFENLAARGLTWRDYYHDFSQTWALQRLQTPANRVNFHSFGRFKKDARDGKLPNYSFIEPKYFTLFGEANDQHPPHDVRAGEKLIAEVYEAVRTSPQWLETLLLISYDEHGGTYDHVLPGAAIPPDDKTSQFAFDRYGVRVPAIVVSPFVPAEPVHTSFDHTSIPATVAAVFGLPGFLTARDAQANRFDTVASLPNARTDVPDLSAHARTVAAPAMARPARPTGSGVTLSREAELSDFQLDLLKLAQSLERQHAPLAARSAGIIVPPKTEQDAAVYVRRVAAQMTPREEVTDEKEPPDAAGAAPGAAPRSHAFGYRVRVSPQSDVCLPFAHARTGDPVQVRFVVTDGHGHVLGTSRYVVTADDPYGGGDIDAPDQNALPPIVSNTGDDDMYVEVTAAAGGASFAVPLRALVHQAEHGVAVVYFAVDDSPILAVFIRA